MSNKHGETQREIVLMDILGEFFAEPDEELLKKVLGEEKADAVFYALEHGGDLFRDPLTGAFDRRLLEKGQWDNELDRAVRYGHPLSVVMVDIDKFKLINDKFGHGAGDCVLKAVATVLMGQARTSDIVIRLGGDEFFIILPETESKGAELFMARVIAVLSNTKFSFGIAEWRPGQPEVSLEELRHRADKDLLKQKRKKE